MGEEISAHQWQQVKQCLKKESKKVVHEKSLFMEKKSNTSTTSKVKEEWLVSKKNVILNFTGTWHKINQILFPSRAFLMYSSLKNYKLSYVLE